MVARPVAQQEVRDAQPALGARAGAAARARPQRATSSPRTSAPARSSAGISASSGCRRSNPGIILARVSGYGQTGPYAERAGFASVAEAMGGLRYINGFPGEPPPRMHISLGDSLAGMFAAQGILAALYWRDAAGSGKGQVVDVSLLESSFALLESTVPEYDRLGIVRGPGGTGLKGVAPSNIFKSSDDKWMVIAANADNVYRRLCEAMGQPELADDERFATHLARGDNQEELEGIVAEWAAPARRRRRSTASSTRPGSSAGRSTRSPTSSRTRSSRPATCCSSTSTPSSARTSARGSSPSSPRRPARCAGRRPGRRAATTARSTAGCSGSRTTSSTR